jgi:hypothetical protein
VPNEDHPPKDSSTVTHTTSGCGGAGIANIIIKGKSDIDSISAG